MSDGLELRSFKHTENKAQLSIKIDILRLTMAKKKQKPDNMFVSI